MTFNTHLNNAKKQFTENGQPLLNEENRNTQAFTLNQSEVKKEILVNQWKKTTL